MPSPSHRLFRLGLTGGIGSGKSTYGQMLAACGATLLDADQVSRDLTAAGGHAIAAIQQAFGPAFITPEGALDRAAMRSLVFSDRTAKSRLQALLHPLIGQALRESTAQAWQDGVRLAVLDIPLLVESGHWAPQFDAVLVVDCSEQEQIQRVQARSGLDASAVQAIIDAQAPRSTRRQAADIVVHNEGISLTDLEIHARQTAALFGL